MSRQTVLPILVLALGVGLLCGTPLSGAADDQASYAAAKQLYADGNYQEALGAFQQLLTNDITDSTQLVKSFNSSLACFQRLNRVAEIDDFREAEVVRHITLAVLCLSCTAR